MPAYSKQATVNQTGRRKLKQKDLDLRVDYTTSPPKIDADSFKLNLPEAADDDSIVIIDANHKDGFQSFELGKVSSYELPSDLSLGEIGHSPMTFQVRVVDPDPARPGVMSWRSAPLLKTPPKEKEYKTTESTFPLFAVRARSLDKGVPTDIEFPQPGNLQDPIKILVNKDECIQLLTALKEQSPQVTALVFPPYLHAIAERLAAEALNETFDPSDPIVADSQWQDMWNALLKSWTGRGLQDFDYTDGAEVSRWATDIVEHWSTMSGNPAKSVSRMLGGY